jgi:hypothetical protein
MGLSDCSKCWDTPCRCGHSYQHFSKEELVNLIEALQKLLEKNND